MIGRNHEPGTSRPSDPAPSNVAHCREQSCNARIVYVTTKTGAQMPCDADSVAAGDTLYDPKKHVSHFKTCTAPNRFGKGKR